MFYNHNSDVNHLPMNPILYLQHKICIYVNDMPKVVSNDAKMFMDDTKV